MIDKKLLEVLVCPQSRAKLILVGEELTNEDLTKVSLYFDALNKEAA